MGAISVDVVLDRGIVLVCFELVDDRMLDLCPIDEAFVPMDATGVALDEPKPAIPGFAACDGYGIGDFHVRELVPAPSPETTGGASAERPAALIRTELLLPPDGVRFV